MKIAVVLGGTSAERDVSFSSGVAIARALQANGHTVMAIDCAFGDRMVDFANVDTATLVKTNPPDIEKRKAELDRNLFRTVDFLVNENVEMVFNGLHGGYGENGKLQALLDIAGIPYSGSGSLASAVGMDKHLSKIIFRAYGVPTADWCYGTRQTPMTIEAVAQLGLPVVIKPNAQGSTVGLSILQSLDGLTAAQQLAFDYDDGILAESFIPGRELTVSILGDRALPVIEIIPKSGIYDYESKYQSGKTSYVVPAEIPANLAEHIQSAAMVAYNALQCRGYARADFRLREDGAFFCLELNTLPGMTATSLVPKAAKAAGISFNELIEEIVRLAL